MLQNIEEAKSLAAKWIRDDEGFSTEPYPDARGGAMRIGYGAARPDDMDECEWMTAERLLVAHLEGCAEDVYDFLGPKMTPDFNRARLAVLYSMAYQMGGGGMRSFKKMCDAIFLGEFGKAADEMLDSAWHKQTPERCERLARMMRSGRE